MTIEQFLAEVVKRIPRKLTAVVICIWAILDWATKQTEINQCYVLTAVTIIAVSGIASHTLLEWKNPEKPEGETE